MKKTSKEITKELLDSLWKEYIIRVRYAKIYSELVAQKGRRVVTDHIAIRTFNTNTGEQPGGIQAIEHILNCLEYTTVSSYKFSKKRLNAVCFEHSDKMLPKIFVSQLEVNQLPEWAQIIINKTVKDTPYILSDSSIELLQKVKEKGELPTEAANLLITDLVQYFRRPWRIPRKEDVIKLNDISQYAAWVLLHGNSVNHFAASINYQDVAELSGLEITCRELETVGVPMLNHFEGKKESILWQSATQTIKEDVEVKGENGNEKIVWTYSYYEFVQRGFIENSKKLFSGFIEKQEIHLFDMTRTRDN